MDKSKDVVSIWWEEALCFVCDEMTLLSRKSE